MNSLHLAFVITWGLSTLLLSLLIWRKMHVKYSAFTILILFQVISNGLSLAILRSTQDPHLAYRQYYYVYWFSDIVDTSLDLLVSYRLVQEFLVPLRALQFAFKWVLRGTVIFVALLISRYMVTVAKAPPSRALMLSSIQLQHTFGVLALLLTLFGLFITSPLGYSSANRSFRLCFGLCLYVLSTLVNFLFPWMSFMQGAWWAVLLDVLALMAWFSAVTQTSSKQRSIVLPETSLLLNMNGIAAKLLEGRGGESSKSYARRSENRLVPTSFWLRFRIATRTYAVWALVPMSVVAVSTMMYILLDQNLEVLLTGLLSIILLLSIIHTVDAGSNLTPVKPLHDFL